MRLSFLGLLAFFQPAVQKSYDDIVLKITGKDSALTSYELTMDGSHVAENKTPSASKPVSGEVNPNTGAEVAFVVKVLPFGVYNMIK